MAAVNRLSFAVSEGQAVAFIGPNGAGKSTTIKMLSGIIRPSAGEARVLGMVPWKERSQLVRHIGTVFGQKSQLWLHLPPQDTFDLLAQVYELAKFDYLRQRDLLVERFGLASFMDTPVRKLSLGQRMRAEIAASLLHRPRLVFLDEPTIGLDVVARQELRDLIREWNREEGLTVFLTSHDTGDIESVAERVIVINHGRVVLDGDVAAVRQEVSDSRVVEVKFDHPFEWTDLPGVRVLSSSTYVLRLEVDRNVTGVETFIQKLLSAGSVADVSIEAPPLEEIIAHLYNKKESDPFAPTLKRR
ncbi:MAG TPA: ATP-binding cassette domain-containing protein [Candidatus Obscuribacterales bacterium]